MPIIRVPVTITSPVPGGPFMNVWHVRTIESANVDLPQALSALEAFYNSLKTFYPSSTVIKLGEGMVSDPLGSPEYVDDDPRTVNVGTTTQGSPATLLSVVCSWRTTSATRSGRGRTFIGPINPSQTDTDGTPKGTMVTTINSAANTLVSASTGPGGWSIGVLSVKQRLLRDITGVSVQDRWAYLSSRRA